MHGMGIKYTIYSDGSSFLFEGIFDHDLFYLGLNISSTNQGIRLLFDHQNILTVFDLIYTNNIFVCVFFSAR